MFILQRFKSLIFVGLCHFPLQNTEAFMKKKLFLLAGLLGLINFSIAQTVVYNEDFDGASISGSCTSRGGGTGFPVVTPVAPGAWCWNDTSVTSVSAPNSYHTETPLAFDTVVFETSAFSTVGNSFVLASFFHKALMFGSMRAEVYVSINNGTSWTKLNGSQYLGSSVNFGTLTYFNVTSYGNDASIWGTNAAPANATSAQWVKEEFNISSIAGGVNGFAQVKLRFVYKSNAGNTLPPASWNQFDGWYIDDVEVVAAPCEPIPPTVNFTLNPTPIPCYDNQPIGPLLNLTPRIGLDATDPSGIQSSLLVYSINGGAADTVVMNTTTPASRREYQFPVGVLAVGDTVDWYVLVRDNSCIGTVRRMPQASGTTYRFWEIPSLPNKCGTANCGSSPNIINTFPLTESFEGPTWVAGTGTGDVGNTHRGTFPTFPVNNWEVAPSTTASGFGWSIRQGGPAANNTGPSGDHTSGSGKFIYLETSQNASPPNSQLITPCIDLNGLNSCASMEFWYHKFGTSMGNLRIDIDTGENTPVWYTGYLNIPGQTQTSQSAPWSKGFIDLTPFIGRIIRVRFVGFRTGGNGDMAIDDIRIFEPDPIEMEMVSFDTPQNGFCSYTSTEDVTINVKNLGCLPISVIPVAFELNGTIFRDTIFGNLSSGDDTTFVFGPKANLSAFQTHTIRVFLEVPGDVNPNNNELGPRSIQHDPAISGYPYILDFYGPTASAGAGTPANPGNIGTTDWEILPPNNVAGNFSWYVYRGLTPTNNTGPFGGYQSNNYLYTESDNGATAPSSAVLLSECINLSSLTNPYLDYFYHFYGAQAGALVVQVKPENSNNFQAVGGAIVSSPQTDEFSRWELKHINLSAYQGQTVQMRIVAQLATGGNQADIAIDKIQIYNQIANDVGIIGINSPGTGVNTSVTAGPQIVIQNYGSATVTSIPLSVTLTPLCGGAPSTQTLTWTGSLAPGSIATFTIPTPPAYVIGANEVCVTTNLTGDINTFNNEFCQETTGFEDIQIPYFNDFESCDYDEDGFVVMGSPGGGKSYRLWDKKIGAGARSGTRSYKTNPSNTGSYRTSSVEALRLPRFIGFDTVMGTEIRFWHKFSFGSGDGGRVEYFTNGNWTPLGDAVPLPAYPNWYGNPVYGATQVPALADMPGFAGSSNGWILSSYPLGFMNNNTSPLSLRFFMGSNASGTDIGWEIDDVELYVPPQYSASPSDIRAVANLPFPGTNQLMVRIENTGARPLDSCNVTMWVDNIFLGSQKVVFTPPLARGRSRWDTIQAPWLNALSGGHNVCAYTENPSGRAQDDFTPDDSLCKNIVILDIINNVDSIGYCNDFETAGINDWLTLNYATYADGNTFWEKGTPSQSQINGAFSGPNAWMIDLNGNYRNRDSSALFSPVFRVDSTSRYSIEFMHAYKTERYHDGGTIDLSSDGGLTWEVVGNVQGNWFNTQFVTSLDVIKPGWTNISNGWKPASLVIQIPYNGPIIFRFRFGSDQGIQDEGWAIDDFCFRRTTAPLEYLVGLEESIPGLVSLGELYPNPADDYVNLDFNLLEPSEYTVKVYDLMGKQLFETSDFKERGAHTLQISTSEYARGMYMVVFEMEGQSLVKRLLVR